MIRFISRTTGKITKNLYFLFFLNGMLLAIILYCYQEDQYEDDIFNLLSRDVLEKTTYSASYDDSLIIRSMDFVHDLEANRLKYFSNSNFESFKATFVRPLTFHLMTANGSCGSYSMILGRLLKELDYPVRFAQMKVDGKFGGHIVLETKTKDGWIVLDPLYDLYFKRPDGKLANFDEVSANWEYYSKQVPSNYDYSYNYAAVQYTNWSKIPLIMPATKKILNLAIGKEKADKISLRNIILSKFEFMLKILFAIYLPLSVWTIYLVVKATRARKLFRSMWVERMPVPKEVA